MFLAKAFAKVKGAMAAVKTAVAAVRTKFTGKTDYGVQVPVVSKPRGRSCRSRGFGVATVTGWRSPFDLWLMNKQGMKLSKLQEHWGPRGYQYALTGH